MKIPATLAAIAFASFSQAQSLSTQVIVSGLVRPVFVTSPVGDFNRLFVLEQRTTSSPVNAGQIRIIDLNTNAITGVYMPVAGVRTAPNTYSGISTGNEQGVLGLAFHPNFMQNGYFYVYFTRNAQTGVSAGSSVVARYRATGGNPASLTGDQESQVILLTIPQPDANHNGGWIAFGPDGNLYIATGDGGNANDTNSTAAPLSIDPPGHTPGTGNAQDVTNNLLGKMLRIDVDGPDNVPGNADDADPANGKPYRIPAGNPFNGTNGDAEIWAYGLRNPWRDSFDRDTGELWIADVGQGIREEINKTANGLAGVNYGWRCMEGTRCTGLSGCTCNAAGLTLPIYTYDHDGVTCSITGGYVYRGCAIPWLRGTYFFGDYCSTQTWSFRRTGGANTEFTERTTQLDPPGTTTMGNIISFGEDALGEMYIIDRQGSAGKILRIVESTPSFTDCNANGKSDPCDIRRGTSLDNNNNGVPDECDPICFADFNQDGGIDGSDVEAFYTAWSAGDNRADVNADGGVDGADVETFFSAWSAGHC